MFAQRYNKLKIVDLLYFNISSYILIEKKKLIKVKEINTF